MTFGQHIRVFISVVIMGCIVGYVLNASELDTDSPYIDYIQAASWLYAEEQTVLDVLTAHYDLIYWEYFVARSGQHVVQFTGTKDTQQFVFQFVVEEDLSHYELGALKRNDILLSPDAKWAYVKALTNEKTTKACEIFAAFVVFTSFI